MIVVPSFQFEGLQVRSILCGGFVFAESAGLNTPQPSLSSSPSIAPTSTHSVSASTPTVGRAPDETLVPKARTWTRVFNRSSMSGTRGTRRSFGWNLVGLGGLNERYATAEC